MLRYSLFIAAVLGSAATAIAAIAPVTDEITSAKNVTIIEKNQAFPVFGPIIVEQCATEDCSEVQS
ncbi:MAG: hypothetical protein ACKVP5_11285 [Aestuariivirga sp.]